jgi:hypothetical protein
VVVDWTTVVDVVDVVVLVVLVLVVDVVEVVAALVVVGSNVNSVVDAFASSESPEDEQAASTRPRTTTAARGRRIMSYIIAESGQTSGDLSGRASPPPGHPRQEIAPRQ